MLAIGLDVGTQSTKCIVYDVDSSQIVGRSAAAYGLISHRHGQAEQDPSIWIEVCNCPSLFIHDMLVLTLMATPSLQKMRYYTCLFLFLNSYTGM